MIRRMKRALLWDKVLSLEARADFPTALEKLAGMSSIEPLRSYERALNATLLLRNGDYKRAESELRLLICDLSNETPDNKKYVRLYCEHILATIEGDLDRKREAGRMARKLDCSSSLKRWLPL